MRMTRAAIRAAIALNRKWESQGVSVGWTCDTPRIIDRETTLPHLLEIMRLALEALEHTDPPKGGRTDKVCKRIRKALAKAETDPDLTSVRKGKTP